MAHVQQPSVPHPLPLASHLASGTKQYLAPEVFTSDHMHGPEADYWSLGIVAFEMLFECRPFNKNCPSVFVAYLEEARSVHLQYLKAAAANDANKYKNGSRSRNYGEGKRRCRHAASATSSSSSSSDNIRSTSPIEMREKEKNKPSSSFRQYLMNPNLNPIARFRPAAYSSAVRESEHELDDCYHGTRSFNKDQEGEAEVVAVVEEEELKLELDRAYSAVFSSSLPAKKRLFPSRPPQEIARHEPIDEQDEGSCSDDSHPDLNLHPSPNPNGNEEAVAVVGDHWAFDYCDLSMSLPPHLVVPIPVQRLVRSPSGQVRAAAVSAACADMLSGLLEVRPPLRLGARHISLLQSHPWLEAHGVGGSPHVWAELASKQRTPSFHPGKTFLGSGFKPFRSGCERRLDEAACLFDVGLGLGSGLGLEAEEEEGGVFLPQEMQKQFKEFRYIAGHHERHFPLSLERTYPTVTAANTTTSSNSSSSLSDSCEAVRTAAEKEDASCLSVCRRKQVGIRSPPPTVPMSASVEERSQSSLAKLSSACFSPFKYIVDGKK